MRKWLISILVLVFLFVCAGELLAGPGMSGKTAKKHPKWKENKGQHAKVVKKRGKNNSHPLSRTVVKRTKVKTGKSTIPAPFHVSAVNTGDLDLPAYILTTVPAGVIGMHPSVWQRAGYRQGPPDFAPAWGWRRKHMEAASPSWFDFDPGQDTWLDQHDRPYLWYDVDQWKLGFELPDRILIDEIIPYLNP